MADVGGNDPRSDPVLREFLSQVRAVLGEDPLEVLLFGSRARGDHDPMSDYDLIMVYRSVTPEMKAEVRRVEARIGTERGTMISYLLIAAPDLPRMENEPFVINARREGIRL